MLQEGSQFRESVGKAVCEIYRVSIILTEGVVEGQSVEVSNSPGVIVPPADSFRFAVLDVFSSFMPVIPLALTCDADPHTVLVERKRFSEIADIELDLSFTEMLGTVIAHTEVEPLVVSPCVSVNSHVHVILPWFWADYHV